MTSLLHILCLFILVQFTCEFILDPLQGVADVVGEIGTDVQNVVQLSHDVLKPVTKIVRKPTSKLLGGVNEVVYNVKKGIIEGINEVVGTPATVDDVNFFLVTSSNMSIPTGFNIQNASDLTTTDGKIILLIHGWQSSRESDWYSNLSRNLLIRKPDTKIVQVDWSRLSNETYPLAAFETESVGIIVGEFLNQLVTKYYISSERFILIGHSLGGHVCGWAGKYFKETIGHKLPRIIALDPAGPLFQLRPDSARLNKNDATVVMVIHTDGGILGFPERCGTIDFFPNGGVGQPGCNKVDVRDLSSLLNPLSCSHVRAHAYMVEAAGSIGAFPARKCYTYTNFLLNTACTDEEAFMGDLDEDSKGSFYLQTRSESPFSMPLEEYSIGSNFQNERQIL